MRITIKLFATLRNGRFDEAHREYTGDTTIRALLSELAIPEKEAAIIFVNSRHAGLDYLLQDGDSVSIFPPIGGG